ncbi:MAG: hypothetical protein MUF49_08650 [Oculatellaceae cyanobacterium Prado106]|jgi:hypothetical protein|nr:hypothetical protein [Oculatellaceae cyanobacterium Prado106]
MPQSKCPLGFNCATLLSQPGLLPESCPNALNCRSADAQSAAEPIQFTTAQDQLTLTIGQAAELMLRMRGNPQSIEGLGMLDAIAQLHSLLEQIQTRLTTFAQQQVYIAPERCEVHQYNVKRPKATYWYNKLASTEAIFEPAWESHPVKVIHLSRDGDARNRVARAGIERRNQILKARTLLNNAKNLLESAAHLLDELS